MEEKKLQLVDQVIEKLQKVEDPELFVDIVNLGLVYGIEIKDRSCQVNLTLTTMGCPLSQYLDKEIKKAILELPEIDQVEVKLVWYPVWTPERMTQAAKKMLGMAEKEAPKEPEKPGKLLDVDTPIKTLADKYPDFVQDMYDIGFTRITISGMVSTVGRMMTLRLGAKAMGFELEKVKADLIEKGYQFND